MRGTLLSLVLWQWFEISETVAHASSSSSALAERWQH
jgi:hypothetical protein